MPVRRIHAETPAIHQDLIEAIAAELKAADGAAPPTADSGAPEILEEESALSPRLQVTVLWDAWKDVGLEARGGIIREAYKTARGETAMKTISRALGLTHAEAARLGMAV